MIDFEFPFSLEGKAGIAEARWNSVSERYELRAVNITSPEQVRVTPYSDAALKASVDALTKSVIANIRKINPCAFQRACIEAYDERQREAGLQRHVAFDPILEYGTINARAL